MKEYIFTRNPFPIGFAATNRILHYGKGLIQAGADCEVVVLVRTERNKVLNKMSEGEYDGVKYRYISGQTERSSNFLQRRIDDMYDDLRTIWFLLNKVKRGDVVLWYEGYKWVLYMGIIQMVCKLRGIKLVRELCELPYATVNDSLWNRFRRWCYEKITMPSFDGFIPISEELTLYARRVAKSVPYVKIPILIDVNQYAGVVAYTHPRPYIFHAGTMTERKDAIVSTIMAFAKASKSLNYSIDFILAGPKSPHEKELQSIIAENNLENNVHFIGKITHKEVLAYQKGAALSILNKNDNPQNRCGFSTKLGDILLAGVPVVTTTIGEANLFLKDGESAYICEPHNIEAIADKIEQVFADNQKRVAIGLAGKVVAQNNFDCNIQGVRLRNFFETL